MKRSAFLTFLVVTSFAPAAFADSVGSDEIVPRPVKKPEAGAEKQEKAPPPPFELGLFGFARLGYDHTMTDERYDFVGRNNGFILDSARFGVQGVSHDYDVVFRISMEGAADVRTSTNTPQGSLSVRLRDAFARWDPASFLGVQAGQFKAPWQAEELRGVPDLMFASRAVGVDGVRVARGFETPGLALDRQLGVMLSPLKPIGTEDFGATYYLMVMNGNGANQLLDDNGRFGLVARSEFTYGTWVKLGAGVFRNDRTVGTPPNLYNEEDLGLTGDLDVKVAGLEVFGAVTRVRTVFPTVGASARVQLAYHAQAAYRFDIANKVFVAPGYRYAYLDPWQEGGGTGFDAYELVYHTMGVRVGHMKLPVQGWLNYTLTGESKARELNNDRIELLGQVTF